MKLCLTNVAFTLHADTLISTVIKFTESNNVIYNAHTVNGINALHRTMCEQAFSNTSTYILNLILAQHIIHWLFTDYSPNTFLRIAVYTVLYKSCLHLDPRAVSRYGWLTTSYGWLAGYRRLAAAYGLHLKSADKLLSKVTFETCRRRLKTFFSNC